MERPYGPAAICAIWQEELGEDFERASHFLRPTDKTVSSYPCPSPGGDGCPRQVVVHHDGEIVAVCGDSPRRCDRLRLIRADIVIHEIDLRKLSSAITVALHLEPTQRSRFELSDESWILGTLVMGSARVPVHLTLPRSPGDFRRVATRLVTSTTSAFVLLTPASHREDGDMDELIRKHGARYLVLDELLAWGDNAALTASVSLAEIFKPESTAAVVEYLFRRVGDYWEIAFAGQRKVFKDSKGFHCLLALLRSPHRDFHPRDLEPARSAEPSEYPGATLVHDAGEPGDLGPVADERTRKEAQKRLREIESELAEADKNHDLKNAEKLRSEKETINTYLSCAYGLGGRPRLQRDPVKQTRDRVSQAVVRSRKELKRELPELDAHLTATLKHGTLWSYRPQQPIDWHF